MNQLDRNHSSVITDDNRRPRLFAGAAVVWVIILTVLSVISINTLSNGYSFDSNVMALLPEEENSKILANVHQVIANNRDRELIFLIGSDSTTPSALQSTLDATHRIYETLLESQLFESFDGPQTKQSVSLKDSIYSNKNFNFLSEESIISLNEKSPHFAREALEMLFSPAAGIGSDNLLADPLGLFQNWKLSLIENQPLSIEDDWLTLKRTNSHYRFIGVRLRESAFDPTYQQDVKALISRAEDELPTHLELLTSGLIVHATYGAEQAKREISTIGIGSLLGITLILLIVFRSLTPILHTFLPLALGCIFSLSICLLLFEKIHLITLAFGTSLIGIAIDYALHFVCAAREKHSAPPLSRIFNGLALALVSSVTAYAAQAITPFPGLRQMAVFAALGLIGAWLSVVLLLPKIINTDQRAGQEQAFASAIARAANHWGRIAGQQTKYLIAAFILITSFLASQVMMSDDLRSLQTSPRHLIESDIRVSKLLNSESIGSYFVVHGLTEQAVLEHEEVLTQRLRTLESQQLIAGHLASSQFIPSVRKQTQNYQLLKNNVYSEQGLLNDMLSPTGMPRLEQAMRAEFHKEPFSPLSLTEWRDSNVSQSIKRQWIGKIEDNHYSIVTLVGRLDDTAQMELSSIAKAIDGAHFVNRPQSISDILKEYRESLFGLLLIAYTLVASLLFFRYRSEAFSIIAPPLIASLTVLAYLVVVSSPLTVFHCLALLLVLGIGLDAAIFLKETRASAYTWLAVSLSSITTFLAFGLLSFSQTPVLHFFGETVAIGIISIWITAPFFCISKDNYNANR